MSSEIGSSDRFPHYLLHILLKIFTNNRLINHFIKNSWDMSLPIPKKIITQVSKGFFFKQKNCFLCFQGIPNNQFCPRYIAPKPSKFLTVSFCAVVLKNDLAMKVKKGSVSVVNFLRQRNSKKMNYFFLKIKQFTSKLIPTETTNKKQVLDFRIIGQKKISFVFYTI